MRYVCELCVWVCVRVCVCVRCMCVRWVWTPSKALQQCYVWVINLGGGVRRQPHSLEETTSLSMTVSARGRMVKLHNVSSEPGSV